MLRCLKTAIRPLALVGLGILGAGTGLPSRAAAADKQTPARGARFAPAQKPIAPAAPKSALLTTEAWQNAPLTPLQPGELDRLITKELQAGNVQPAPLTTDEQFVRRVTLDLTGELPAPADVTEFAADRDPGKRAKLIDKLLDTEEYAQHWAHYWRDVVITHLTANPQARIIERPFEPWLKEQVGQNRSWGSIARAMIAADGELRLDEPAKNGAAFFLLSHRGADAANEQAAETSRVFLGIQIQCAQCHDHPSDQWKRVQFHELAAYFSKFDTAPIRNPGAGNPLQGFRFATRPFREHEMPSKEDPKKTLVVYPRFLDGKAPSPRAGDLERRRSLADAIVDKNNYWFAGAYVNRVWGELMGQSFYQPVDDMGPQKEAVFPAVLTRLTGSFRGSDYDMKAFFRAILTSETYQRQIRLGESADQHLHFAAAYPTRLRADTLWQSLEGVLGKLGTPGQFNRPRPMGMGPYGGGQGLEFLFKEEFNFDPSLKSDEVEGSIPQALLMMNNTVINQRIQARGTNVLGRILSAFPKDDDALRMLYLKTLARKPTDREMDKCRTYLQKVNNRAEAFEDLLWALLNSTEFQTKR